MNLEENIIIIIIIMTMMVISATYLQLQGTKFLIGIEFHQRLAAQKYNAYARAPIHCNIASKI
jgi:hypothetical protein